MVLRRCGLWWNKQTTQPIVSHRPMGMHTLGDMFGGVPLAYDGRRLQRALRCDGVAGVFARAPIPAGSLLAMVPVPLCVAPTLIGWSPFGPALDAIFSEGVSTAAPAASLKPSPPHAIPPALPTAALPKDVCLVTAMCALHLLGEPMLSPVGRYIARVAEESVGGGGEEARLTDVATDAQWRKYRHQCACRDDLVAAMHDALVVGSMRLPQTHVLRRRMSDVLGGRHHGLGTTTQRGPLLKTLRDAHHMCESRCATVPNGDDCFGGDGGPSLVPFVDLINHDFLEPNVAIAAITDVDELEEMTELAYRCGLVGAETLRPTATASGSNDGTATRQQVPCVVVVAATALASGEELHYQYIEPDDPLAADEVFWALRFHFVPAAQAAVNTPRKT